MVLDVLQCITSNFAGVFVVTQQRQGSVLTDGSQTRRWGMYSSLHLPRHVLLTIRASDIQHFKNQTFL